MTDLLEDIRSRGYWRFIIRPASFDTERVEYERLYDIMEGAAVNLGGWQVPPIDPRVQTIRGQDWIEQRIDWEQHKEIWRFYQSGQLVHYFCLLSDWLDRGSWVKVSADWSPGHELSVPETLFRLTGEFELAARLSLTPAGDKTMHVALSAHNLSGRVLTIQSSRFAPFRYPRKMQLIEYFKEYECSSEELVARPRQLALDAAGDFFQRFDWTPPPEILRKHQDEACRF